MPLRYFLLSGFIQWIPLPWIARWLQPLDKGLFKQAVELQSTALEQWASAKLQDRLVLEIPSIRDHIRKSIVWKYILVTLSFLLLVFIIIPKPYILDSGREIITGTIRPVKQLELADTIVVGYQKYWTNSSAFEMYKKDEKVDELLITQHHSLDVLYKGRFYKELFIYCDSLGSIQNWRAKITPPSYLNLQPYYSEDTLRLYNQSSVEFELYGILVDQFHLQVSRETRKVQQPFIYTSGDVMEISNGRTAFEIPVRELRDKQPDISIIKNTIDSLTFEISDDFGVLHASITTEGIRSKLTLLNGLINAYSLSWNNINELTIDAQDAIQTQMKKVKRPKPSATELLSNTSKEALSKLGLNDSFEKRLKERMEQKRKDVEKLDEKEEEKVDEEFLKIQEEKTKNEPLEELIERLEQQWQLEQMVDLLEQVKEEGNEALDSAIQELNKELDADAQEGLEEIKKDIESIQKEGSERQEQAKESAEALQALLNQESLELEKENVERIKRLLKSSWSTSLKQELIQASERDIKVIRDQRTVLKIEHTIQDSLDLLIVQDPMLVKALGTVRSDLNGAMVAIQSDLDAGKSIISNTGYAITALNKLDEVLYFILDEAKQNLMQSKAKCKNGSLNQKGTPKAGKGQPGSKGEPNKGKKPGGRKEGKTGEPREGKGSSEQGQKPGSSGKDSAELLKELEDAISKLAGQGQAELQEELEALKQKLLFTETLEERDFINIEDKLWQANKSQFDKEERGEERESNEAENTQGKAGIEVQIKHDKSINTDLPLPVLKRK